MNKEQFNEQAGEMLRTGLDRLRATPEHEDKSIGRAIGMDGVLLNPATGEVIYCRLMLSRHPMPSPEGEVTVVDDSNSNVLPFGRAVH